MSRIDITATPGAAEIRAEAAALDRAVGQKVRQLRVAHGITQEALAAEIGVSSAQLQKYEQGINRISAGRLYRIAQALGVSVNELFGPVGRPPQSGQRLANFMALAADVPAEKLPALAGVARSLNGDGQ